MSVRQQPAGITASTSTPRPDVARRSSSFARTSAASRYAMSRSGRAAKRALDLAVAGFLLVVFFPLLVAIATLIRVDSAGPIFFRQKRIGLGGRTFDIFKFRTMHVLEDGDEILQARLRDARVTRIGRLLRKASLDELPQLLNVIRGDMSLVGPRPHAVAHDRHYSALIEAYASRHAVRPGITGWAQIHGLRGQTPTLEIMHARVTHDLWYVQHASIWLDLHILLRTPREILRPRNAY